MISVVVYRGKVGRNVMESVKEFFGPESVEIRGLGNALRYEVGGNSVYFVELRESYELHRERYEHLFKECLGHVERVISINPHIADTREGIFVHSAGNFTRENTLGSAPPLSISPTDPTFIGLVVRAVHRFSEELELPPAVHIEATHDLPVDAEIPYVSFEYRGEQFVDLAALALVAGLGRRKMFKPYMSIGVSYYADEFIPGMLRMKKAIAYHVPFYLAHYLTEELVEGMRRKGWIKGVVVGRGVRRELLPL